MSRRQVRLRQIALVADKLEPHATHLIEVLGLGQPHRDPNVGVFGLENVVLPVGGDFLEIVAPVKGNTSAGRFLARRGGPGGYMVIVQTDDANAERERISGYKVRAVWTIDRPDYKATHFHPADTGGFLLSVDSTLPGADVTEPLGPWQPAGPGWLKQVKTAPVAGMTGCELTAPAPEALADLWSKLLDLPLRQGPTGPEMALANDGLISFVAGPAAGIGAVRLKVADKAAIVAAAKKHGIATNGDRVTICGLDFILA
jgi:hypothetical protein